MCVCVGAGICMCVYVCVSATAKTAGPNLTKIHKNDFLDVYSYLFF